VNAGGRADGVLDGDAPKGRVTVPVGVLVGVIVADAVELELGEGAIGSVGTRDKPLYSTVELGGVYMRTGTQASVQDAGMRYTPVVGDRVVK
jgi:hypothetical protein